MDTLSLKNLIAFLVKEWPINDEIYPELKGASENDFKVFATDHILLHLQITFGEFAKALEPHDHKNNMANHFKIKASVIKYFTETLRAAEVNGHNEQSLLPYFKTPQRENIQEYEVLRQFTGGKGESRLMRPLRIARLKLQESMGELAVGLERCYFFDSKDADALSHYVICVLREVLRIAFIYGYDSQTLVEAAYERLSISHHKAKSQD